MAKLETQEKLDIMLAALEDKKAEDIKVIDLSGLTLIADHFVICSGTSNVHIRSIVDGVLEKMKEKGAKDKRLEGYTQAKWVLLDYGDVVLHVFAPEEREFYDIESLWRKTAQRLEKTEVASETARPERDE